jgi:hypothetical protein
LARLARELIDRRLFWIGQGLTVQFNVVSSAALHRVMGTEDSTTADSPKAIDSFHFIDRCGAILTFIGAATRGSRTRTSCVAASRHGRHQEDAR